MTETRLLMISSSLAMGLVGLAATFLPQEILGWLGTSVETVNVVAVQIVGALYLGFGFMNWMAKGVIIGGIYSRPLAMGNFLHFGMVGITLVKHVLGNPQPLLILAVAVSGGFAFWFGRIIFNPPKS